MPKISQLKTAKTLALEIEKLADFENILTKNIKDK